METVTYFLLYVTGFLILGLIPVMILFFKYRNPYRLIMVFGKKGSGKTTFLAKTAYRYIRKGRPVYSTVYVPGAYLFDVNNIGVMTFPPDSVIFIDEVGMIWDNRNFKNFRTDVRDYFKLQRHYNHTVYLFSQTFDIDIKLRNLTDAMYLVRCYMGFFSVARKIRRDIVLVEPQGDSEARIADSLAFEPVLLSLFGAKTVQFTFVPRWVKLFDSFEAPQLSPTVAEYQPVPDTLRRFYHLRGDNSDKRRVVKHWLSEWHHRIGDASAHPFFKRIQGMVHHEKKDLPRPDGGQDRSDME